MKGLLKVLLTCLLAFWVGCNANAQHLTTMGTEFWVTDIPFTTGIVNEYNSSFTQLAILAVAPRPCTVTVTNQNTGWDTTLNASPSMPGFILLGLTERSFNSELIYNYGFHVTATDSIALMSFSPIGGSYDETMVLPKHALGTSYVIHTMASIYNCSEFSIIATEDSTTINIIPTCETLSGRVANDSYSVIIPHAGQCMQITSVIGGDLSGTRIWSNDNKPFAVFQGNFCVTLFNYQSIGDNLNCFFEQSIPLKYWGRHFIIPHSSLQMPDMISVVSAEDNCTVLINGNAVQLNAGQVYSYITSDLNSVDYLVATQKVSVDLIYCGRWIGLDTMNRASKVTITPWEQSTSNCYFHTNHPNNISGWDSTSLLHVVAKSSDINTITLNGNSIAQYFSPVASNPVFSHAMVDIDIDQQYNLYSSSSEGFTGYVITTKNLSSAFSIGSGLWENQNALIAGNTYNADMEDTIDACSKESLALSVESLYGNDSVRWYFGDGTTAEGDALLHSFNNVGLYHLTAIAYASCDSCYRHIDTMQTNIRVYGHDTVWLDTFSCQASFTWFDSTYTEEGYLEEHLVDRHGCDSLIIWHLTFRQASSAIVSDSNGCDSIQYGSTWYFSDDTLQYDVLTNSIGCDSITYVTLSIYPSYDETIEMTILDSDTITWIDGNTYSDSTDTPFVTFQTLHGCDSIIRLHLNVVATPPSPPPPPDVDSNLQWEPVIDSSALWVPNVFTPEENSNKVFQVFCNDLLFVEVSIFNRQGLHVITFDGLNESWDGTYKNKQCSPGTYIYVVKYTTKLNPNIFHHKKGTVILLR